ncbi:MAG: hypothetical protein GY837_25605, partial [Bosea sp.]|uniref:hypothetical protein n=1 Tax=Bosea sp. (in: a-proteobacteria) TaxID=1871050 RepID=UPI0031FF4105|nr:hypothetical protein [Bosea sp. (in: a-proteobacteria)]
WSALPVSDRLALPWTTHLAEAAGPLFHLANAPDPESVRAAQAEPKQWLVLGSGRGPGDAAGGSDALARIIAGPAPRLTELYEGFRRQGLSLIAGSDRVRRWIDRLEGGEPPPPKRVKKRRADAPIEAIVQAGELARKSSDPHGFLLRETSKLLPREPLARARMVVDLLLSPALRPWVKRLVETEFRDKALRSAGAAVLRVLPRVGELARRGNLLLRIAASLGERWSEDPVRVTRFLHQAADLGRWDAVAALLRASERGRHSLLDDLALRDEHRLLAQIGDAARQPAHRWDLLPFAGRIASSCRR